MASLSPDHDLHGWFPIRAWQVERQWRVDWCWFGDKRLTQPFFRDDVEQALRLPFNQAFRRETILDGLRQWHPCVQGLCPLPDLPRLTLRIDLAGANAGRLAGQYRALRTTTTG